MLLDKIAREVIVQGFVRFFMNKSVLKRTMRYSYDINVTKRGLSCTQMNIKNNFVDDVIFLRSKQIIFAIAA